MYMGKDSEARKRLQRNNSFNRRRQSFDGRQRSYSRGSQYGSSRSRYDKFKSRGRDSFTRRDRSLTQENNPLDYNFPQCIACRCQTCNQTKKTYEEIKKMIKEKLDVKIRVVTFVYILLNVQKFNYLYLSEILQYRYCRCFTTNYCNIEQCIKQIDTFYEALYG